MERFPVPDFEKGPERDPGIRHERVPPDRCIVCGGIALNLCLAFTPLKIMPKHAMCDKHTISKGGKLVCSHCAASAVRR